MKHAPGDRIRGRRQAGRRLALAAAVVALASVVFAVAVSRRGDAKSPASKPTRTRATKTPPSARRPPSTRLTSRRTGTLAEPVQDAAAAPDDRSHELLLGGLTGADTSTAAILRATPRDGRTVGKLPQAVHDAAAVRLGGAVYLFGGGTGGSQSDAILRVQPSGRTSLAGRLPQPSSDQAAAALRGTAYVVGGFTGSRWLDTIVAWRPGAPPRVAAHLPSPVRYAAVAAVGDRLIVAGGSLPNGTASATVVAYTPLSGRVSRLGRLPAPTTHAAAAALGSLVYVIGGRSAVPDTPTSRIVAVDPRRRRVRAVGRLPAPLSDAAATTLNGHVLVAGGRSTRGTVASLVDVSLSSRAHRPTGHRAARPAASATNVYADDGAGMLSPVARRALPRIYVPNTLSGTVDVIDPRTFKVVEHFAVGALPQHVTPAWDLRTLYVLNDLGNSLTPIDPTTGKPGKAIPVDDPYNMYFTPDGRYAIVVAERLHRLDFRDAHTFRLRHSLRVPCAGVDHVDFSADGSYMIASCEFSGQMLKIDVARERVLGVLTLPDGSGGMPQDVKLSPDGKVFYVADMRANGLWEIDGDRFRVIGFLRTGRGVHGLYPSRDGTLLYATNRGEGSISVISFASRRVLRKWRLPGGGSPDMGGVSADGRVLWLAGRWNGVVYAISTRTGKLLARIPVGSGPHGLCVWPQPGRYSLGHTGVLR